MKKNFNISPIMIASIKQALNEDIGAARGDEPSSKRIKLQEVEKAVVVDEKERCVFNYK